MNNIFNKISNLRHKRDILYENKDTHILLKLIKGYPSLLFEILLSFIYIPHFYKNKLDQGFIKLSARDKKGTFLTPYTHYQIFQFYAVFFL